MFSILCKAHSQAEIISHTSKMQQMLIAHSEVMQHPNFARIELDDLRRLFTIYDIFFFERYFTQHYKGKISFYFSERMHSSAGIMCFHESERTYEIGIDVAMLFDNFTGNRGEMEDIMTKLHSEHEISKMNERELSELSLKLFAEYSACIARSERRMKYALIDSIVQYLAASVLVAFLFKQFLHAIRSLPVN